MTELGGYLLDPAHRISDPRPQLAQLEARFGFTLPADYRALVIEYGGYSLPGFVEAPILEPGHDDEFAGVEVFFGVYGLDQWGLPNPHDLLRNLNVYANRVPPGFLPIARAPGGNLICLVIHGDHTGAVYYWDHETQGVLLAARTFSDFLSALSPGDYDEEEEDED
jgi:hypothetical protein